MGAPTEKVSSDILISLLKTGVSKAELPSILGIASRSTSDRWFREGQCSKAAGTTAANEIFVRTGKRTPLKPVKPKQAKPSKRQKRTEQVMEMVQEKIAKQEEIFIWLAVKEAKKDTLTEILDMVGVRYGFLTDL